MKVSVTSAGGGREMRGASGEGGAAWCGYQGVVMMVWRLWWMQWVYAYNFHFCVSVKDSQQFLKVSKSNCNGLRVVRFGGVHCIACCIMLPFVAYCILPGVAHCCQLPIAYCCLCCPMPIADCQFWISGCRSEKCLNIIAPNKDKLIWVQFWCTPPDEQDTVTLMGILHCVFFMYSVLCILYLVLHFVFLT